MQLSKRRRGLITVTTGILIALFAVPQTGWLARQQVRAALGARNPAMFDLAMDSRVVSHSQMSALDAAAARFPGDLGVQMARAESAGTDYRVRADALQKLEARFPSEPALLASELRMQTMFLRVGYREECRVLAGDEAGQASSIAPLTPQAAAQKASDLARFGATANAGARLVPRNVYFALMWAAYLFEMRRDNDAEAEIVRAGDLPDYDAYVSESLAGKLRFARAAQGEESGSFTDTTLIGGHLYSDIIPQRMVSLTAVWRAMERERSGSADEGITLRLAVARLGETIRTHSTSTVGVYTGAAMVKTASLRPGGAPAFRDPLPRNAEQRAAARFVTASSADGPGEAERKSAARFVSYLSAKGYGDDARWYQAAANAAARTSHVGENVDAFYGARGIQAVLPWYMAGLVLLWFALTVLLIGFGAHCLTACSPWVRRGATLPPAVRWGVQAGLAAPFAYFALPQLGMNAGESQACLVVVAIAAAVPLLVRARYGARLFLASLAIAAVTTVSVLGAADCAPQIVRGAFPILHALDQIGGFWSLGGGSRNGEIGVYTASALAALFVVVAAYPLALLLLSKRAGVPPVSGMLNGLRGLAVPLACVALLAYGAVACVTAHYDAVVRADLGRMVRREARFLAERRGETWPAPVPPPIAAARQMPR